MLPLANWANRPDSFAVLSPMFERGRKPPRLISGEFDSYVIATSTNNELKAVWAGRANLQAFKRRL